jgi:hypothetical protein
LDGSKVPDVPRRRVSAVVLAVKSRLIKQRRHRGDSEPAHPPHFRERRAMYQSDITQFLNQLKQQKPALEEEQRRGRALLWDKQPIDLEERAEQKQSRVEQTPYVYYQNF